MPHPAPPSRPDASNALVDAALAASRADDGARAVSLFQQACAAEPHDAKLHFLLGSELAAAGRFDEAETSLAQAVLLAPAFDIARYQLGLLLYSVGRAASALVTWGPLLQQGEGSALRLFVLGFACLAQGDAAAGRVHFEAGLACSGDHPALQADIRAVLVRLAGPARLAPARAEVGDARVLIANYGRPGPLH